MTEIPDSHRDLLDRPVAVLATNGPDGIPQATAVWFLFEDGRIRFALNTSRQKTKNLQRDPKATVVILDDSGYRYLEVRGNVTLEPDPDYEFSTRVGAKYGGADIRAMDGPGESRLKVTIEPTRVHAVDLTGG